jgi:hypothetical protein
LFFVLCFYFNLLFIYLLESLKPHYSVQSNFDVAQNGTI